MTIEEAIKLRHSVRRYLPKPLTTDQEKALQKNKWFESTTPFTHTAYHKWRRSI